MDLSLLALTAFVGVSFVTWAVVADWLKVDGPWVGVIILISTCAAVAILSGRQLIQIQMPSSRAIGYLLAVGAFNGVGFYCYTLKIAEKSIPIGILSASISIMMVIAAPVLDYLINSKAISVKQFAGFGLASIAIYLINN